MARLNVNPTRMEMTRLKGQLKTATRGHKLLKDKLDELMKQFMEVVRENRALRRRVEEQLMRAQSSFTVAAAVMSPEMLEQALMAPRLSTEVTVDQRNIMSIAVPVFHRAEQETQPDLACYGFAQTSGELDDALQALNRVYSDLLELAQAEKTVQLLAQDIERTRRRVNALEYVVIPENQRNIRYITMKLEENERGNTTRLMKVKDMLLQQSIEEQRQLVLLTDSVQGFQLCLGVQSAVLGGVGNVHHAGEHHVVVIVVGVEGSHQFPQLGGVQLAVVLRQGNHLVAGVLDGTGFMTGYMAGGSSHHALPPLQHGRDDDGVALGAAGDELHIGLRAGAGGADLLPGAGAVGVGAVAGDLFKVGLGQLLQNGGMCTLAVVVFKIQHGKTLLYIIVRKQYLYSTSPCKPCQIQNGARHTQGTAMRLQMPQKRLHSAAALSAKNAKV